MSMKVMQNYQYLMQIPTGKDQNLKNIGLNNLYYQNCLCKHLEDHGVFHKQIENKIPQEKKPDDLALRNKSAETFDSFKRHVISEANEKEFDTPVFYNRMDLDVSHIKSKSKIDNKMNDVSEGVRSASSMQVILETNFCNRTPSNDSKTELNSKYFNQRVSDNYAKTERFKLFEKEIKTPNFYTERNLSFLMGKNQNANVCIRQNTSQNCISKRVENSDLINKSIDNFDINDKSHDDSDSCKRIETSDLHIKKNENVDMYSKAINNPNVHNQNVETSTTYTKQDDVYSKSQINLTYSNKDIQPALTKKHFMSNMLSAKINLCSVCRRNFSTKGNLQNHHIVHSGQKPHECSVCKKTFSQRSTLGKHYLIHTGEKPHICKVCGRGFRQANNLRIHFLTHSGEKPHLCPICDRRFTQKIALQKHMLTHSGVKPHECDVCKRCFTTKGNLQKHFLTHTGEKPHICDICNRGFSQKIALKKHHLTHTGEKPHTCNVCGKGFTTKGNLKSHFKRHNREKLSTSSSISESSLLGSSSASHSLFVPRSIAQSILSSDIKKGTSSNSMSASNSIPTSLVDTKYIHPTTSYAGNPSTVASSQSQNLMHLDKPALSKNFILPKSLGASHYTMSNHQFSTVPSSSHALLSAQFSKPQNLTSTSHQVSMFYPSALSNMSSNASVFSSHGHQANVPTTSSAIQSQLDQTSRSLNRISHVQKQILSSSQALSASTSPVLLKPSGKDVNIYALCSSPIKAVPPVSYPMLQSYQSPSVNAISQFQRQMYNSANMPHPFTTTSTSQIPPKIPRKDVDHAAMDSAPLSQQTSSMNSLIPSTSYSTVQSVPSSEMMDTYQSQSVNAVSQAQTQMISHSSTPHPHSSPDRNETGNLSDTCSQPLALENPPIEPIILSSSCSTNQPYINQACESQSLNVKSQVQKQNFSTPPATQTADLSISYGTDVSLPYTCSSHVSLQTPPISSITPPFSYSKHSLDTSCKTLSNSQNNAINRLSSNLSTHTEQMHVESDGTKTPHITIL